MTARFAGSRTLDERRRRWLATNESERAPSVAIEKSPKLPEQESPPSEANLRHFPIRKVISPKGWKIAVVSFFVGLLGLLILGAGTSGTVPAESWGPGWRRLMNSNGGGLARLYHAGLLMMSGQLALLIWWGRSQSLRDFEGHYRIWLWAGLLLMFAGWGLAGEWHWAWSDTVCWLWSARFPQREVVCWMLPPALAASILWKKLSADMRECKTSYFLLWLAGLACFAACVFRLEIDRTDWPSNTKQLVGASLRMLTCVGVFVSFLIHARYVIHISPEPPELRPTVWARVFGWINVLFQKLLKPRLKFPIKWKRTSKKQDENSRKDSNKTSAKRESETASKATSGSNKATETKHSSPKTPPRKTGSQIPTQPDAAKPEKPTVNPNSRTESAQPTKPSAPSQPAKTPPKQEEPKPASKAAQVEVSKPPAAKPAPIPAEVPKSEPEREAASSEPQLRLDDPLDPNQLKGLSKKDRRKLRKQHRDAQRKT